MIDICYVGNSSKDTIIVNNKKYNTLGGSCIYSSFSSRASFKGKIAIVSNVDNITKNQLEKEKIKFYGNVVDRMTAFEINEEKSTCIAQYYNDNMINLDGEINVNYLHVSFRKGVNIEEILESPKLKYSHLSIDVMIHSVTEFIPMIEKYVSKIEILFCNIKEYNKIKKHINKIPLIIVTNEDKPVLAILPDCIRSYQTLYNNSIKSTTGAGDTFIGGFLAKYVINQNIDESIEQAIYNSNKSIELIGPILNQELHIKKNIRPTLIPNNIIVIGNSCAGKTTFVDCFKSYYNIYSDIDDFEPLSETFMIDDLIYANKIKEFKEIKKELIYTKKIWEEYNNDINNINNYTKPAVSGNGHDIIRPILWDEIVQMSLIKKESNNIVQFSRGNDKIYNLAFSENAYFRGIGILINNLENSDNTIIINITSKLKVRKIRNKKRYENGGHYVSDNTMDNIYADDTFEYKKIGANFGYLEISNKLIPVYTITNDKMLNSLELNKFLEYNVNSVIKYYNKFKEEENGIKENTERYLAKQSK